MQYTDTLRDATTIDNPAYTRTDFLQKTYLHLFGAIAAFVALEVALFQSGLAAAIGGTLAQSWLLTLGGFMVVGWLGSYLAHRVESLPMQYAGLGLYVLAEALIFTPILVLAVQFSDASVLPNAIALTLGGFAVLTGIVAYSGVDFSFLRAFVLFGGIAALVAIVASLLFSITLGFWFSLAMVVFAAGNILFQTSAVIREYDDTQYVAASLGLFASVALFFYYILMIFVNEE